MKKIILYLFFIFILFHEISYGSDIRKKQIVIAIDVSASVDHSEYEKIKNALQKISIEFEKFLFDKTIDLHIYEWSTSISSSHNKENAMETLKSYLNSERSSYGLTSVTRAVLYFMNEIYNKNNKETIFLLITDGINNEGPEIENLRYIQWSILNKIKTFVIVIENEDQLFDYYRMHFSRGNNTIIFNSKNFDTLYDNLKIIFNNIK